MNSDLDTLASPAVAALEAENAALKKCLSSCLAYGEGKTEYELRDSQKRFVIRMSQTDYQAARALLEKENRMSTSVWNTYDHGKAYSTEMSMLEHADASEAESVQGDLLMKLPGTSKVVFMEKFTPHFREEDEITHWTYVADGVEYTIFND